MSLTLPVSRAVLAVLALAASQACLATVTTLTLLPHAAATNVAGNGVDAATRVRYRLVGCAGRRRQVGAVRRRELAVLAPVLVSDIASISYWTNEGGRLG